MKIALYHNLPTGGARRVAYEHARRLAADGHELRVYEPASAERSLLDLAEVAETVRVPFAWPQGRYRRLLAYSRLRAMQQGLAREIDAAGFDVLYVHHCAHETAPSILRHALTPSVYFCQEPARWAFEAPLMAEGESQHTDFLTSLRKRHQIASERTNALAATVVLANSSYSCESILRAHGRAATRCTLGVDSDFFTPCEGPREDFVLSVGGFAPHKGFRFLLRALSAMPEAQRPELVLAGDRGLPGEVEALEKLATEQGVRLRALGRVTEDQLRDLYRRARVFVYAPYLEPLGLAPLEAMACGTAVLGVREGGVRETVVDGVNGRLAERDEGEFARVLAEMLADPAALEEMGQQGREWVRQQWTWDQSVREVTAVFESLVSS